MARLSAKLAFAASVASLVAAAPVEETFVRVPVKQRTNTRPFTSKDILAKDIARLEHYNGRSNSKQTRASSAVYNELYSYIATPTVGSSTYDLIVDTGSSNTWVGADTKWNDDGTSTGSLFAVSYGSGTVLGTEWTAPVTFGGLTVSKQSIGVALLSEGFDGVDGIIGFGPVDLTEGTVGGATTVPTFTNNLKSAGAISTEVLGVYFAPESGTDDDDANGELTVGGVDTTKYTGTLTYISVLTTGSFAPYWGITVSGLSYAGSSIGSSNGAIVDTGTTLIYIPTAAYTKFLSATGGKTDASTGLAHWTTAPTGIFTFTIGGASFSLTPSQYLLPTAQYSNWGVGTGSWGYINEGGSSGVDFIIGQKFLENYYSVFDTTNKRIGFATRA